MKPYNARVKNLRLCEAWDSLYVICGSLENVSISRLWYVFLLTIVALWKSWLWCIFFFKWLIYTKRFPTPGIVYTLKLRNSAVISKVGDGTIKGEECYYNLDWGTLHYKSGRWLFLCEFFQSEFSFSSCIIVMLRMNYCTFYVVILYF